MSWHADVLVASRMTPTHDPQSPTHSHTLHLRNVCTPTNPLNITYFHSNHEPSPFSQYYRRRHIIPWCDAVDVNGTMMMDKGSLTSTLQRKFCQLLPISLIYILCWATKMFENFQGRQRISTISGTWRWITNTIERWCAHTHVGWCAHTRRLVHTRPCLRIAALQFRARCAAGGGEREAAERKWN